MAFIRLATQQLVGAKASLLPLNFARSVTYKAPINDMTYVLRDVLDAPTFYKKRFAETIQDPEETISGVLTECARFSEEQLAPLYESADDQGCHLDANNNVTTPKGFKEAYKLYSEAGWQGLSVPTEYGGQGLPVSLNLLKSELLGAANWSWSMYPGLTIGCLNTLLLHGSDEQKKTYIPKLVEGIWSGTMCLTEPGCGTDLGQMQTKAVPLGDGRFKINGKKIFISCGEHDMTDNIIHIVLAKLPDAPEGTKGISLFLVPKFLIKPDGSLEKKRNLTCISLEKKMGIKGSATCEMEFSDSIGYIIGKPNEGLRQMFTFMNTARLGTGIQGLSTMELAHQLATPYSKTRMSGRALSGTKEPKNAGDAIIHHADIRKMLLTQKAFVEAGRCLLYRTALIADEWLTTVEKDKRAAKEDYLGFFTPIVKGFLTEMSLECASHSMQVFGGHGYIKGNVCEQVYRDARISTLYEGTTGIQALDLLGRKTLLKGGKHLRTFTAEVLSFTASVLQDPQLRGQFWAKAGQLSYLMLKWNALTAGVAVASYFNPDQVSGSQNDYLMYSGYVTLAYYWLRMATVSARKLKAGTPDADFHKTKIQTCQFYFDYLLPRSKSHASIMTSNVRSILNIKPENIKTF